MYKHPNYCCQPPMYQQPCMMEEKYEYTDTKMQDNKMEMQKMQYQQMPMHKMPMYQNCMPQMQMEYKEMDKTEMEEMPMYNNCCQPQCCCCPPPPKCNVIHKYHCKEVKHPCCCHTHVVNHHVNKHTFYPVHTCSEEHQCCDECC